MAAGLVRGRGQALWRSVCQSQYASFSSAAKEIDLKSDISLQEARTWDEGVSSNFAVTSMSKIFKGKKVVIFGLPGAFTGVCSQSHVPSFLKHADSLKAKGVEAIICVSVNDPYTMNGWAEKLGAKSKIQFFGDFEGKFHKSLDLTVDLTAALLGPRSKRYAAFVDNGQIKVLNVEKVPSEFKVSDAETMLKALP